MLLNVLEWFRQRAKKDPILQKEYFKEKEKMHKKIEMKAAKALKKDAHKYHEEAKHAKGAKKKHEKIEEKEASSAAKDMAKRAKKAHEY